MHINDYKTDYNTVIKNDNGLPDFIKNIRKEAYERIKENGLPDREDERYKYLDFDAVFDKKYSRVLEKPDVSVDLNEFFHCEVENMDTKLILFSNGWFYDSSKADDYIPDSVIITSMRDAFEKYPEIVKKHYNKYLQNAEDGWADLNTLLSGDGIFIYVPDNIVIEKPIQVVNLTHGFSEKEIFQRNLFITGKNSEVKIVLCDHSLTRAKNISHIATEAFLDENSGMQLYDLQNEPDIANVFNHTSVYQSANSHLTSLAFSLHGGTIRNNIYVKLAGKGADSNVYGLVLSDREQRMDNFSFIDHAVSDCTSNEFFKSILDENSRGAFSGKILVRKDSQNTNAYQTNNNICLTETAKMRTKPQLEIYADDVKCSHGATVGQLDEEAMFYLRSRGIDKDEALFMMMYAFANEVVRKIKIKPLRERVEDLVSKRLRGEPVACEYCLLNCGDNF